jgi:hypothetical protein
MINEQRLETLLKHYIVCALWSSTDDGVPLDDNYGPEDLAPETYAKMRDDCAAFLALAGDLIKANGCDECELAGHDFWLTRNGHSAGFWDGDWDFNGENEPGETLTRIAWSFKEVDLYVGDDGKVYGS